MDFDKQLQFVNDVIGSFEISEDRVRVGVASFSYRYKQQIPLGAYNDKEYLQAAVENIRQSLGGTYTYDALDGVRTQGLNPKIVRPDISKIAIVMTDGESYFPDRTAAAAKKLKEAGVNVFAVGIGDQVNNDELKSIASEPTEQYLFNVGSYELLDEIKEELAMGACEGMLFCLFVLHCCFTYNSTIFRHTGMFSWVEHVLSYRTLVKRA